MITRVKELFARRPLLSAFVLGALFSLGFAPVSFWLVSLFSLTGLFLLCEKAPSFKQGFWRGYMFGFGHFLTSIHWLIGSFLVTLEPAYVAWGLGAVCILLLSAFLALFMAIPSGFIHIFKQKFGCVLPLVLFPALWVVFECIRSQLVPTFAWSLTLHVWAYEESFLQMIPYVGLWGLSFLFVFCAVLFARVRGVVMGFVLLLGVYIFGNIQLQNDPVKDVVTADAQKLHMRLVPGFVPQKEKWQADKRWRFLEDYIAKSAMGEGSPDVMVWPETSVTYFIESDDVLRKYLRSAVKDSLFIFGAPKKVLGEDLYYNSLYVMDEKGGLRYRYDKRYLVPFGEYFPYKELLPSFFKRFLQGQGGYSRGAENQEILTVGSKTVAPLICGEVVLPNVRNIVQTDADFVLNITNDAWFRGFVGPYQHLAIAKVQAVLLRKPIVRVAHGGISAVIDEKGRILVQEKQGFPLNVYF